MSSYLAAHLENKQHRREENAKRRKRITAGLPGDVPLKPISLSQEQKRTISVVQPTAHRTPTNQMMTPSRLSALIALSIHLIAALIGARYIVQSKALDDDAVVVEMMEVRESTKRRLRSRVVKRVETPQSLRVETPHLKRTITTAVEIPMGAAQFALAPSDVPIASEGNVGLRAKKLGRDFFAGGHPVKVVSVIPMIKPQRTPASSIIEQIESEEIPQASLDTAPIEPLVVDLTDVTQPPRFLNQVSPRFPSLARRAGKGGVVLLEALIGVDGVAKDIRVVQGIGYGCDEAAIEALKASRFAPAMQGDKKVIVRGVTIPYRFSLEQS